MWERCVSWDRKCWRESDVRGLDDNADGGSEVVESHGAKDIEIGGGQVDRVVQRQAVFHLVGRFVEDIADESAIVDSIGEGEPLGAFIVEAHLGSQCAAQELGDFGEMLPGVIGEFDLVVLGERSAIWTSSSAVLDGNCSVCGNRPRRPGLAAMRSFIGAA